MFISSIKSSNNPIVNNVKFRSLMIGLFFFNCSDWIERLCISWLILQSTESILATTISFAIGQIIQTFFSIFDFIKLLFVKNLNYDNHTNHNILKEEVNINERI